VNGKPLLEVSNDRIIRTFEVNTLANFWTTRGTAAAEQQLGKPRPWLIIRHPARVPPAQTAFLPEMLKRREGHIVTVASAAGLLGVPGLVDYCSSKVGGRTQWNDCAGTVAYSAAFVAPTASTPHSLALSASTRRSAPSCTGSMRRVREPIRRS